MEWTLLKILNWTTDFFKKKGIPSARLDAELLLADTLKLTRVQLYTRFDQPLAGDELTAFKARVSRRANREPVAYILGHKEFWSLDFLVGPGVLIPRPDTERLVEEAIKLLGPRPKPAKQRRSLPWNSELTAHPTEQAAEPAEPVFQVGDTPESSPTTSGVTDSASSVEHSTSRVSASGATGSVASSSSGGDAETSEPKLVLDLCTGTAIIPVCVAKDTGAKVIGVDISTEALDYARKNVEKHALANQVALLQGDLTAPVPSRFHGRFDLLTSNPPYIPPAELETLEPEVNRHEPRLALEGGADGLEYYRRIAKVAPRMVKPGGWVLLEIGETQGEAVRVLLLEQSFEDVSVLKDLAGSPRVVKARRPA